MKLTLLIAVAVEFLSSTPLLALETGDTVVVMRPTELKAKGRKTTPLSPGTCVVVRAIRDAEIDVSWGKLGSVDAAAILPYAEALVVFSETIEKNPKEATAWLARGKMRFSKGKHEEAIADLDQGLMLDPSNSEAFAIRGFAWKRSGNVEKALADFDRAITLDPRNAFAWRVRGATYASLGEYDKTVANYNESVRIDSENPESLHHRVVFLAGCIEDRFRNGKQALADATKACEVTDWKNPGFLMGLSMAYAETGDFDAAIRWETKAIELSPKSAAAGLQDRLEGYRAKRPFRAKYLPPHNINSKPSPKAVP